MHDVHDVVLVDDDELYREILSADLADRGFAVSGFADAPGVARARRPRIAGPAFRLGPGCQAAALFCPAVECHETSLLGACSEAMKPEPRGCGRQTFQRALLVQIVQPLPFGLFHDYDHAIEPFDRAPAASASAAIACARSSATFSTIGERREALSPRRDRAPARSLRPACLLLLRADRARGLCRRQLCRGGVAGRARPATPRLALKIARPGVPLADDKSCPPQGTRAAERA